MYTHFARNLRPGLGRVCGLDVHHLKGRINPNITR